MVESRRLKAFRADLGMRVTLFCAGITSLQAGDFGWAKYCLDFAWMTDHGTETVMLINNPFGRMDPRGSRRF